MRVRTMGALGAVLAVLLGVASPAAATQGSVPIEVAEFATSPDGLIRSLDDFFGPGADGTGIDFDETTEIGAVHRVFSFTPAWLAGGPDDTAVGLANEWAVPVVVGGGAVGVAVVWINPGTVKPQLADFLPDPDFAEALAAAADEAYLVEDSARGAWFTLAPPTLTALRSGTSGVTGSTTLAEYREATKPVETPAPEEGPALGSVLSVGTIVVVALVVVLVLLLPSLRRRKDAPAPEPEEEAPGDD